MTAPTGRPGPPRTPSIENATALADLFGHWPDFHDAELRAVRLSSPSTAPAVVEMDVEVAERSDEVDARGYYKARQRCAVTLRCEDVAGASLTDFGRQNVLDDLQIVELTPEQQAAIGGFWGGRRFRIRCVPVAGFCEVDLLCARVLVVHARSLLDAPPAP